MLSRRPSAGWKAQNHFAVPQNVGPTPLRRRFSAVSTRDDLKRAISAGWISFGNSNLNQHAVAGNAPENFSPDEGGCRSPRMDGVGGIRSPDESSARFSVCAIVRAELQQLVNDVSSVGCWRRTPMGRRMSPSGAAPG